MRRLMMLLNPRIVTRVVNRLPAWLRGFLLALIIFLFVAAYYLITEQSIDWPLSMIFAEAFMLTLLWFRIPFFKRIFGEGKGTIRNQSHVNFNIIVIFLFFLPTVLFYFNGLSAQPIPVIGQLSILAVGVSFAGLAFTAASINKLNDEWRDNLISIAQKFKKCAEDKKQDREPVSRSCLV